MTLITDERARELAHEREALAAHLLAIEDYADKANHEWAREFFTTLANTEHSGDCTKQPWSCSRCICDEYFKKADTLIAAGFRRGHAESDKATIRDQAKKIERLRAALELADNIVAIFEGDEEAQTVGTDAWHAIYDFKAARVGEPVGEGEK